MADAKISQLTIDSIPDRGADYGVTYDVSAATNKRVLLNNFGAYPVRFGFSNASPADVTTYYFGLWDSLTPTVTAAARRIHFYRAGKITAATIFMNPTVNGTTETGTISFRLNNTTDTTLSSTFTVSSVNYQLVTGLSIAIAQGDYGDIKWLTPTWATNPTGVYGSVMLWVE
jgi:hypothetical protein